MELDSFETLRLLFLPVLLALPFFFVMLIGIGFSIYNYKNHRKISLLTISSLLLLAIISIVHMVQPLLSIYLVKTGSGQMSLTYMFGTIGTLSSILNAIALALLLFSIWSGRNK